MNRWRRALLATAASAAVLATPTVASAATLEVDSMTGISSHSCDIMVSFAAGTGCFENYGEYFYLQGDSTSTRVALEWKLADGSRHGLIRWKPTDQFTWGVKNKSFDEGKTISIRIGTCNGGGCDTVGEVSWWSGWRSGTTG